MKEKIALVTGGTSGIGKEIVLELLREGCKVITCYSQNEENALKLENEVGDDNLQIIKCDISNEESVIEMVNIIKEKYGSIDYLVNNAGTFILALCLTGWMGTAGRTRTQFYRFKNREYVFASRTLGASHFRLIFKHILPNSMGTIITGSVLMITSVIFSEANIAYLNLGLQGVESFGVMMSENQQFLGTYPNLVIFPAVIISLLMISFNLFGNGLRDAFNPSLKGSE